MCPVLRGSDVGVAQDGESPRGAVRGAAMHG